MRPNILMITLDDMNYDSAGFLGNHDITPNIDRLAKEGMYFKNAHVTVSVCQPSRQCIMTGLYPHNNGSHGFTPIMPWTETLQEILSEQGYYNGIISKIEHLQPSNKYCWDFMKDLYFKRHHWGRIPTDYYEAMKEFFTKVEKADAPFFLMANSHDPHRPFSGSSQEIEMFGLKTEASKRYEPDEINVPGFLPDLPDVRREVADYFTSVHRADESVGLILKALEESGKADDTIVIFLSDNGMAFPFSKTNCYLNSTKTPLIIKWPGRISAGVTDSENMVAGVDIMPTLLDVLGFGYSDRKLDGQSFYPLLIKENDDADREMVFTLFNATAAFQDYEMRCVQSQRYGYIFNEWSDGERKFRNESMSGLTFNAMVEAAKEDESIKARVDFFLHRVPEEFYDFKSDPHGYNNLIDDPEYAGEIARLKEALMGEMKRSKDPMLDRFMSVY